MSFPMFQSSAGAVQAALQLRGMAFVSVSEAGDKFGSSSKGRSGSKVMSLYRALVDAVRGYVEFLDK
ncbi:MAG: hypothetical protein OXC11_02460, partial [Rhodospirillales bacterium]|nr:hypothetical protein [Rhodospirillales bacterium]